MVIREPFLALKYFCAIPLEIDFGFPLVCLFAVQFSRSVPPARCKALKQDSTRTGPCQQEKGNCTDYFQRCLHLCFHKTPVRAGSGNTPSRITRFAIIRINERRDPARRRESDAVGFAVNLNLRKDLELDNGFRSFGDVQLTEHLQIHENQPLAGNTFANPERVVPKSIPVAPDRPVVLPRLFRNMLRYRIG